MYEKEIYLVRSEHSTDHSRDNYIDKDTHLGKRKCSTTLSCKSSDFEEDDRRVRRYFLNPDVMQTETE